MTQGAYSVHKEIKQELENYIKTQYFGKTPLLFSALREELSKEGVLYREPYIESTPAYVQVETGFSNAAIDDWMKSFFHDLADNGLGVYSTPFKHQISALEAWANNKDVFVSTGTGSGKTECFMWPLVAKLAEEAKNSDSWNQRGVRAMIMYPMNALVSDQLGRLRKMIGDPDGAFVNVFSEYAGADVRRPQFGMYTGRTPYPGSETRKSNDKRLAETYKKMTKPAEEDEQATEYYNMLLKEGRIPAKANLERFVEQLENGDHVPESHDAELLTRFEMQKYCPDILITNYSMLEYMLLRPREAKIWNDTKKWLHSSKNNRMLFIIDEAHMYRGSSGGEVALLIRRMLHKLDINYNQVQFILTTASMPHSSETDIEYVQKFANDLTGKDDFVYLFGKRQNLKKTEKKALAFIEPNNALIEKIESEETKLDGLNDFWNRATGGEIRFSSVEEAERWMYDHLCEYDSFVKLIESCRGNAISISDLADKIFPDQEKEKGATAVSLLISVAQLARSEKDMVLFPAKMHLLFRGLKGVFACCNENCSHSHTDNGVKLGEVLISDGNLICPECGSLIYELCQDRRCGALFFKGYVVEEEMEKGKAYLWHYPGQLLDHKMYELHLYIPPEGFSVQRKSANSPQPCYLNIKNGFIDFLDDRHLNDPNYRKLYYSEYRSKDYPDLMTFAICPHCQKNMSKSRLTSFSTRGNQSFNNLIKAQFNAEDPNGNRAKNPKKYPNEGRKVLLFSDSRQRAATLARDMSEEADTAASRQLFMCALANAMKQNKEISLDQIYGYYLHEAVHHNVSIFDSKFKEDCNMLEREEARNQRRSRKRQRQLDLSQYTISTNSTEAMQEQILRLYCGNFNTLTQNALSWVEPIDEVLENIVDDVGRELGINIDEDSEYEKLENLVIELFSAWFVDVCDANQAIGHTISNSVRNRVRRNYKEGFGLKTDWTFSRVICQINGWSKEDAQMGAFKHAFNNNLLEASNQKNNDSYYIKLDAVKPLYDPSHIWYKCKKCSEVSPYLLNGKCPCCGSEEIKVMNDLDYEAMSFWRKPAEDAIAGAPVRVIDTEEHTAQLSHKDQQDEMWSKTEEYEMRFQDMVKDGETPVDILSSTTTMEVGIDIGSLVAVGLRNIPPMRENYQQRAGRAGRRGSALSTIVTFCENGPYDTLYFNKPAQMFRGDPRRPWIDTTSKKLLHRHLNMLVIQDYLNSNGFGGMDEIMTMDFIQNDILKQFFSFINIHSFNDKAMLLGKENVDIADSYKLDLIDSINMLKNKCNAHPELYTNSEGKGSKSLLDALYEEGIIPTYSFPKDVVSLFINDYKEKRAKIKYQVERGLDVAIGEYAPGRSVVVDKSTYQVGGLYYPGTDIKDPQSPAKHFVEDPNYNKPIISCKECGWFGIQGNPIDKCPFCGNSNLEQELPMIRPWGFAPKDAKSYPNAQIDEEYSAMKEPLYSTLPSAEEMEDVTGYQNVRKASRVDQSIIMLNKGPAEKGFTLCPDCGAIMPAERENALQRVYRPYRVQNSSNCSHANVLDVNLGYELKTDMLVLEFKLDPKMIDARMHNNLWLTRASASLAEGLRLVAGEKLDIEFTELITGYRIRDNKRGIFVDIYMYDSLSSGAGYSEYLSSLIGELLQDTYDYLEQCNCASACYDCLKHYRNQHIHGKLDRHAALDLLRWGERSQLPGDLNDDAQWALLNPLKSILFEAGVKLNVDANRITAIMGDSTKKLIVYPAMIRKEPAHDTIAVSDYLLKYAKPTAVEYILNSFK